MKFSLVIPTSNRPKLVRAVIRFLEKQKYKDFELIISDNYSNPKFSGKEICENASIENLFYFRPQSHLSMVDNWNFSLSKATGDYICFFTDKMMLLPDTLQNLADLLNHQHHDIVSWIYDRYNPDSCVDFFGSGLYISAKNFFFEGEEHLPGPYDPREALQIRASCHKQRNHYNSSEYTKGKICFGAYSRELVDKTLRAFGQLFHNISPDYSSMVLASVIAESAYELEDAGVVHINSKISNGGKNTTYDDSCLKYIKSIEKDCPILPSLPVPSLYSSLHNCVLHDYSTLKEKFSLQYEVDLVKWLVQMNEDINLENRVWSSEEIELSQKNILENYISTQLSAEEKERFYKLASSDSREKLKFAKKKHHPIHCSSIFSILNGASFK